MKHIHWKQTANKIFNWSVIRIIIDSINRPVQSLVLQVTSHSVKPKSTFESRTFKLESKSKSFMHKSRSKSPKSGLESYSSPSHKYKYCISADKHIYRYSQMDGSCRRSSDVRHHALHVSHRQLDLLQVNAAAGRSPVVCQEGHIVSDIAESTARCLKSTTSSIEAHSVLTTGSTKRQQRLFVICSRQRLNVNSAFSVNCQSIVGPSGHQRRAANEPQPIQDLLAGLFSILLFSH